MRHYQENSITDMLIAMLLSGRSVRVYRSILYERHMQRFKKASVQTAVHRLHKKGYIQKSSSEWVLTNRGKKYSQDKNMFAYIATTFKKNNPKNLVLAFDIPEAERVKRNWLRNQLKIFGYEMLQKSLWFGSGPLPKSFTERLDLLNIRKKVKIFSVNKTQK